MHTDKNPFFSLREVEELHTVDDVLAAAIAQQKCLLEELEAVKTMQLSPKYNRQKAELAVKAVGELKKSADEYAHLVVEVASEYGVPQRVMAEHVGVAPATVLRWIRNPLGLTREEYEEMMTARLEADITARDSRP